MNEHGARRRETTQSSPWPGRPPTPGPRARGSLPPPGSDPVCWAQSTARWPPPSLSWIPNGPQGACHSGAPLPRGIPPTDEAPGINAPICKAPGAVHGRAAEHGHELPALQSPPATSVSPQGCKCLGTGLGWRGTGLAQGSEALVPWGQSAQAAVGEASHTAWWPSGGPGSSRASCLHTGHRTACRSPVTSQALAFSRAFPWTDARARGGSRLTHVSADMRRNAVCVCVCL